MQAKISNSLIPKIQPGAKPYEIADTELKGFLLRVQPSGLVAFYVSYRAINGKRNRISLGRHPAITPAQARDHAKQILADVVKGGDPAQRRKAARCDLLADYLANEYGPWVKAHRKDGEATMHRLLSCFDKHLDKKLSELTPVVIERWRTKRLAASVTPATINRDIASLRSALSKAVEWGHLETHPLDKVKRLGVDNNKIIRWLKEDEETRLRDALSKRQEDAKDERARANIWRRERRLPELQDLSTHRFTDHLMPMILLALNTGIRQGELFNLRWQDVDLGNANLTIIGTSAKSGKTRHIPLNTEALETMKEWHARSGTQTLVFPNAKGEPFDNVKKSWTNLLTKAGIVNFRWHDMRHHFARETLIYSEAITPQHRCV